MSEVRRVKRGVMSDWSSLINDDKRLEKDDSGGGLWSEKCRLFFFFSYL